MNRAIHIGIAATALACLPGIGLAEREIMQPPVTDMAPGAPVFPPNERCSTNAPCTNIAGEIMRIEESYWIRAPNGREVHLKVTGDSNLKELPKVGDNIAAQLDSTGGVQALMKLSNLPKSPQAEVPSKTYEDLR